MAQPNYQYEKRQKELAKKKKKEEKLRERTLKHENEASDEPASASEPQAGDTAPQT